MGGLAPLISVPADGGGPTGMNDEMSFELAGGPYAVTASRLAIAGLEDKLDPNVLFDMRLLVSELVTNCVKHAQIGPDESIQLAVEIGPDTVKVSVRDHGPGFEPPTGPPSEEDAEAGGGWGLFLVEQLSKSWGVERQQGATVWFELPLHRADDDAGDTSRQVA
jgi:anti-sigma regulatory factor (Ser/Thr protein kinase)